MKVSVEITVSCSLFKYADEQGYHALFCNISELWELYDCLIKKKEVLAVWTSKYPSVLHTSDTLKSCNAIQQLPNYLHMLAKTMLEDGKQALLRAIPEKNDYPSAASDPQKLFEDIPALWNLLDQLQQNPAIKSMWETQPNKDTICTIQLFKDCPLIKTLPDELHQSVRAMVSEASSVTQPSPSCSSSPQSTSPNSALEFDSDSQEEGDRTSTNTASTMADASKIVKSLITKTRNRDQLQCEPDLYCIALLYCTVLYYAVLYCVL